MHKKIGLLLFMILMLTGCTNTQPQPGETSTDDYTINWQQASTDEIETSDNHIGNVAFTVNISSEQRYSIVDNTDSGVVNIYGRTQEGSILLTSYTFSSTPDTDAFAHVGDFYITQHIFSEEVTLSGLHVIH